MRECYKYTGMKCKECGGEIVMDVFKEELYCLKCSLVMEESKCTGYKLIS